MPAANHVVLASGAVVAVSVAVATAIALYESPELRRYADDVRRRIAIALHAMGDGINPPHREPLFNRPEDADGFLQSTRGEGAQPGVDADEETRRRQREELLYWNSLRLEKEKELAGDDEKAAMDSTSVKRLTTHARGSSFDDFLRQDGGSGEQGAFVFNTGADTATAQNEGLRRRGEGIRSTPVSLLANPFADEHFIVADDIESIQARQIAPDEDEITSDIYSTTSVDPIQSPRLEQIEQPSLIELHQKTPAQSESSATVDQTSEPEEYMTPGQDDRHEAYASIQAWAQGPHQGFYSPLPSTPTVSDSEADFLTQGQLTPTDSVSVIGSTEDVGNDAASARNGETGRPYDVMSESDGMMTPASWSEVGSVVSGSEVGAPVRA